MLLCISINESNFEANNVSLTSETFFLKGIIFCNIFSVFVGYILLNCFLYFFFTLFYCMYFSVGYLIFSLFVSIVLLALISSTPSTPPSLSLPSCCVVVTASYMCPCNNILLHALRRSFSGDVNVTVMTRKPVGKEI